ncbi:MAG: aldo/keto reductase [Alphaproteobacteria bacterium]|nr:MAG: aldo/keto reductase [Alphaproteobacteria bacterium]
MVHAVKANGAEIPALGLGTWDLRGRVCEECVDFALSLGYRHIDTAAMYDNEAEVGRAIRASSVPREEIFLTTKVWYDNAAFGPFQRSVEASLGRLGLDYVDLVLIHWPDPDTPVEETMRALSDVKARGWTRHVGVSNYTVALLEEAVRTSTEPLVTNQVEYHPYLDQTPVLEACRAHGMSLTAYSPLAKGRVFADPVLQEIGDAHGKSAGQVALRWLIQQPQVIAIPRSSKHENIRSAFEIWDFSLSDAEMARISALGTPRGRMVNFDFSPRWD